MKNVIKKEQASLALFLFGGATVPLEGFIELSLLFWNGEASSVLGTVPCLNELADEVIGIRRRLARAVVVHLGKRARGRIFVRIDSLKRTVLTCIVAYFLHSVKGIVQIFYLVAVAVGQRFQFSVALVVGIACQPKRDGRSRPLR